MRVQASELPYKTGQGRSRKVAGKPRTEEEDADEEGDVVVVEEVDLALRDVLF